MIWDCVLYNGERDLLEIRMEELSGHHITHVLVEARQTFQGEPKEVEHLEIPNVIHHVVDLDIDGCTCGCQDATRWTPSDAWVREAHQRNALLDVIRCNYTDLVLLGDIDEIPSSNLLGAFPELPCRFLMDAYFFDFKWFGGKYIPATVVCGWEHLHLTPAVLRHADMATIDGGWHLTYMGGVEAIEKKVASFSHAEVQGHNWEQAIATGVVPWTGVQLEPSEPHKLPVSVQKRCR
jgi:beta-1,4-mannosyl-glycoprotein beta-1,4-N-acetylglucosaminyltransferase